MMDRDSICQHAWRYIQAGISIIPVRLDGTKAPDLSSWKPFQERLPTIAELRSWFRHSDHAIGVVCGAVSGGLEVLDFDDGTLMDPWRQSVADIANALTFVATPSGGWHVLYRCCEIAGNTKIAMDPSREKQTLIETRGQGGYIVGAGSPATAHPANKPYEHVAGAFPWNPWTITPDERRELWRAARAFNRDPQELRRAKRSVMPKTSTPSDRHPVIQKFIEKHSVGEVLERNGWTSRDGEYWTRPGKAFGVSAHVVQAADGTEVVRIFTSSTELPTKAFNSFELARHLEHAGDSKAAFAIAQREAS